MEAVKFGKIVKQTADKYNIVRTTLKIKVSATHLLLINYSGQSKC